MAPDYHLPTVPSLLATPGRPFLHRDLSWLQFNERVLSQARSQRNPPLERAKFLSITASNLDEFFMIRFASVLRSSTAATRASRGQEHPAVRVRDAILEAVARFNVKQAETFDVLSGELEPLGMRLVRRTREGDEAHALGRRILEERILGALAPLGQFPVGQSRTLENLQMAAIFPNDIWLPIPATLAPVIVVPLGAGRPACVFFLDHLLADHLGPALRVPEPPELIRVTRDGDFTLELQPEDPASIPDRVRSSVTQREMGRPVRLQYAGVAGSPLVNACLGTFRLPASQAYSCRSSLALHGLRAAIARLPEAGRSTTRLFFPAPRPFIPEPFRKTQSIFEQLKRADLLLHHPYDSFEAFVTFIRAACEDPDVTRIEQTIYRTDAHAGIFDAIKAVARRKTVRVIIEPRARFDELNNLRLTAELRAAGVEVGFGFGRLKLHAKIALVTRREAGGERHYTHLSTGNYNFSTARQYEDFAILTANPEIGKDARYFLDSVWQRRIPGKFRLLLSAPASLHRRLLALIEAETRAAREKKPARIFAKVNALVDEGLIEQLYRASRAGVQVDLVVRGACALIPGVKGLSENVRVIGLVDRYLEHSRIYAFSASRAIYLSSADWMPRNFFSRLELAFPVLDPNLYRYLEEVVFPAYLADTEKARELTPEGTWKKRTQAGVALAAEVRENTRFAGKPIRCQFLFEDLAAKGYQGTPLQFRLHKGK